jgi:hypothetical protein
MDALNVHLAVLQNMFPSRKEQVEKLYRQNADFRSICDDYFSCIGFIQKFKKEFADQLETINEYETVRDSLEKEMQDFMEKNVQR